jgi:hypothetical protein
VGLKIDKKAAEATFLKALKLARSKESLPKEWLERTRKIGEAPSKTFTPALATALLAKATNRRVDAFSLREGEGHKSYSARNLAKDVLVPQCVKAGVDIRTTGAEPLNNQPFLRSQRIGPDLDVRKNAKEELLYLCECLERADFLENRDALRALAAFLRARLELSAAPVKIVLGGRVVTAVELGRLLDGYVMEDADGGKVGQALGAAILDLVFDDVRAKKVNDPGVRWPGDVGVFDDDKLVQSVEVKQKPMSESEVLQFAARLMAAKVKRALVLAFAQGRAELPEDDLVAKARSLYGVELAIFTAPGELLAEALRWSRRDLVTTLAALPERGLVRLQEIEAAPGRCKAWGHLFDGGSSGN